MAVVETLELRFQADLGKLDAQLGGLAACVSGLGAALEAQREALATEFAAYLLGEDCQKRLADIGGFAVTDVQLYSSYSAYAPMEALLRSRSLAVPDAFSEHSPGDAASIVLEFLRRSVDAETALMRLGLKIEGYESQT